MFPVNSAERAPAARGIRRKIIKVLLLVEWCVIGENSKDGITSFSSPFPGIVGQVTAWADSPRDVAGRRVKALHCPP